MYLIYILMVVCCAIAFIGAPFVTTVCGLPGVSENLHDERAVDLTRLMLGLALGFSACLASAISGNRRITAYNWFVTVSSCMFAQFLVPSLFAIAVGAACAVSLGFLLERALLDGTSERRLIILDLAELLEQTVIEILNGSRSTR